MAGKEPVRIRGVVYESHTAAARALGITQRTVSQAVDRGFTDNLGLGRNAHRKIAVRIGNARFDSLTAAAEHLGGYGACLSAKFKTAQAKGQDTVEYKGATVHLIKDRRHAD